MTLQEFTSYRKAGGWLQAFWILGIVAVVYRGLMLILSLLGAQTAMTIGTITRPSLILSVVSSIIALILDIAMVLMISKRNKKGLLFFAISTAVQIISAIVMQFVPSTDPVRYNAYVKSLGIDPSTLPAITGGGYELAVLLTSIAFTVIWMVVWLLYFKKSKRAYVYFLDSQKFNEEYTTCYTTWQQSQQVPPTAPAPPQTENTGQ